MNINEFNEAVNGKNTYVEIANKLNQGQSVIIGWTDEKSTHLDILFSYRVCKGSYNYLQRGLRGNELFVSIIGFGAFGFDVDIHDVAPGYVEEKLNIRGVSKLAELINEIKKLMYKSVILIQKQGE